MKDMVRFHGRRSRRSEAGFISALFLSVFLCLCLYTGILTANIKNRSEVILNLKREQEYFAIEDYLDEIVPIVPLWTSFVNIGTKAGVEGAVWMPTAKHDYRLIQIP